MFVILYLMLKINQPVKISQPNNNLIMVRFYLVRWYFDKSDIGYWFVTSSKCNTNNTDDRMEYNLYSFEIPNIKDTWMSSYWKPYI